MITTNNDFFNQQWGLRLIKAPEAWIFSCAKLLYPDARFVYHHAYHLTNLTLPEDILKATDNFMSYNTTNRKTTWHWHWQWKIIRDNIKKYTYL